MRVRAGMIGARAGTLLLAVALASCGGGDSTSSPAPSASDASEDEAPWFEEVAAAVGVDFVHTRGDEQRFWFPEIMGSGVAVFDHDADGDLDLYFVQAGDLAAPVEDRAANRLYENDGTGRFQDVTARAGVGDRGYGMGCAVGDADGDGDLDLYVTNVGPNVLYRNDGDGTFTDVTAAAGVGDASWGTSAAFFDADGDGDLDLYLVNYLGWSAEQELECAADWGERDYCNPNNYSAPTRDVLYRNEGDGRFTDATVAAGLDAAFGNGLGVSIADFDLDGLLDVYVTNDGMPNELWMNQGGLRFEDRALLAGCAVNMQGTSEAGMGVAAVDVDNDGDFDLFMTHLRNETNTFYVNKGGFFADRTRQTGLSGASLRFTGFGLGFADFDQDGQLDLYVANGRVGKWKPPFEEGDWYGEPNQLFRGLGGVRFEEVSPREGLTVTVAETSRGAAFGDLDGDGDVDVVVNESGGRARLLRNIAEKHGAALLLRIVDTGGRDAIGARVRLCGGDCAGDDAAQWRQVSSAYSYGSANDLRVHFGLGTAQRAESVLVVWPDGTEQRFGPLEAGAHVLRR